MALLLRTHYFGWWGLLTALGGGLLAAGIVFLFYAVRAMGAGDLKLLAALGTLVGPHYALTILMGTALAGGVMALIYATYRGQLWSTLFNVGAIMRFHLSSGLQAHPEANLDNPAALRMPYGLPIAAGAFYAFVTAAAWR